MYWQDIYNIVEADNIPVYRDIFPDNPPRKKLARLAIQFSGVCLYLYYDDTYEWQDTSGG